MRNSKVSLGLLLSLGARALAFAPSFVPSSALRSTVALANSGQAEFAAQTVTDYSYLNDVNTPMYSKAGQQSWFDFYGLSADFSKVGLVSEQGLTALVAESEFFLTKKEETLPEIDSSYTLEQIEEENKAWFPTHCATYYKGRGDLTAAEYYKDLVYHMSDGPIFGNTAASEREGEWPLGPPHDMVWALVQFYGEFIYFEWFYLDKFTGEPLAKGSCTKARRGHRGGVYYKSEQLTFYRGVKREEEETSQ